MAAMPRISQAEWAVMEVLWDQHPLTAADVAGRLSGCKDWSPRTVKTLLSRLAQKGAVLFEPQGKRYAYRPAYPRSRYVRAESKTFLRRVFAGQESAMLVQMVRDARLSAEEIEELRDILLSKRQG